MATSFSSSSSPSSSSGRAAVAIEATAGGGEGGGDRRGGWRRVDDVGLFSEAAASLVVPGNHYDDDDDDDVDDDPDNAPDGDKKKRKKKKNHPKTNKTRKRRLREDDLEASPHEEMGFFYGLEVISGDDYEMVDDHVDTEGSRAQGTVSGGREGITGGAKRFRLVPKQKQLTTTATAHDAVVNACASPSPLALNSGESSSSTLSTAVSANNKKTMNLSKNTKIYQNTDQEQEQQPKQPAQDEQEQQPIQQLQDAWMHRTGGVRLHDRLCASLLQLQFHTPTPIQAATLAAAILGQHNIVGAAPTGSGKTLAYLLPILQAYLEEVEDKEQEQDQQEHDADCKIIIQALIVAPTRELVMQIQHCCEAFVPNVSVALVGGLARVKQARLLQQRRPPILVGTPGRLWEWIRSIQCGHRGSCRDGASSHWRDVDLSRIRYLVVDEADRMIQQGSFPELTRILDAVHYSNINSTTCSNTSKPTVANDHDDEHEHDDTDQLVGLVGLPGLPGEARVTMLPESDDKEENDDDEEEDGDDDELENPLPPVPMMKRKTYIFSATLTLPTATSSSLSLQKTKNRNQNKKEFNAKVDGAIAEILDKARATGKTKVVDLTQTYSTNTNKKKTIHSPMKVDSSFGAYVDTAFQLPPGLTLYHIKCTQKHKDSHLYAYLMTTAKAGPCCLVFCNSIAAVRRVGATLETLGVQVRILHAQMPQRSRLKAVESLRNKYSVQSQSPRSEVVVVVATDVAARGLDIPSVASVVHYDLPRSVDLFVHRSGRTARGIGQGAVGSSLALLAPADDAQYAHISQTLQLQPQPQLQGASSSSSSSLQLQGQLLHAAQERVNLACRVLAWDQAQGQCERNVKWFQEHAEEAGLELDDRILDEIVIDNPDSSSMLTNHNTKKKDRNRHPRQLMRLKAQLAQLLSEPMQIQRHGKFMATHHARMMKCSSSQS